MYKRRQSYQKHERQFGTRHDKSKYKLKPQTTVVMGKVENASGLQWQKDTEEIHPPPNSFNFSIHTCERLLSAIIDLTNYIQSTNYVLRP